MRKKLNFGPFKENEVLVFLINVKSRGMVCIRILKSLSIFLNIKFQTLSGILLRTLYLIF